MPLAVGGREVMPHILGECFKVALSCTDTLVETGQSFDDRFTDTYFLCFLTIVDW